MSNSYEVYLKVRQLTEVHSRDVHLKDVAEVWCQDTSIQSRCLAMKIKKIPADKDQRYVVSTLDVIHMLQDMNQQIQVSNLGEADFIIDYKKPEKKSQIWQWMKTLIVCVICFSGGAFAIMTFNNDVDVGKLFEEVYTLITGAHPDGFTVLEASYSVGLAVGIIGFFNHFALWKFQKDPTPLEVEMRLYEDNVSKTLIQNKDRKEQNIDVS